MDIAYERKQRLLRRSNGGAVARSELTRVMAGATSSGLGTIDLHPRAVAVLTGGSLLAGGTWWLTAIWDTLRLPAQVGLAALITAAVVGLAGLLALRFWSGLQARAEARRGGVLQGVSIGYRGPRFPDRDFDVGPHGFSGHFDKMLSAFREGSAKAILTLAVWVWVLFWPRNTAILDITPTLSVADLIVLGLMLWTAYASWPILVGLFWGIRWLNLERRGLYSFIRNGHVFRIQFYRRKDHSSIYNSATQVQRFNEEIASNHQRREVFAKEGLQVGLAFLGLVFLMYALQTIPHYLGADVRFAARQMNIDEWASNAVADMPELAVWLLRPDVHGIVAPLRFGGLLIWLYTFVVLAPRLCELAWTCFAGYIHWKGFQYIPGAKVLEGRLFETTLEDVVDEGVHGNLGFLDPLEGARRLSRREG